MIRFPRFTAFTLLSPLVILSLWLTYTAWVDIGDPLMIGLGLACTALTGAIAGLTLYAALLPDPAPPTAPGVLTCRACSGLNVDTARFCNGCGAPLAGTHAKP